MSHFYHRMRILSAALAAFMIGSSLVSAQQLFLGTVDKVYIVDKTENNPTTIHDHPAWAAEFSISKSLARPMDVITNSFCAGGSVLGNGTWVNIGGNQAVTYGGATALSQNGGSPYNDPDGGKSLLNPCDDNNCDWILASTMTTRRWYPSIETLEDGSLIIIGGCEWGGFVNDAAQSNPTYEYFPSRGNPITSPILTNTLPLNLYPLTFLLPSGRLLIQANWQTAMLDYQKGVEYRIDDIPDAVRTYPASAGVVMMPLTPSNNWTATVMFCGGTNIEPNAWVTNWNIAQHGTSSSCVQITPDVSPSYNHVDPLPEGRTMGNLILLPTGQVLCLNGAGTGVAGYGNDSWAIGQSYADHPILQPVVYNSSAPSGSQWSRDGLSASVVPRMYHSTATLLPDGSVLVAGSNPNSDYVDSGVPYPTEYRIEKFYPTYFSQRRPAPTGIPASLGYGGPFFNLSLSASDLFNDTENVKRSKVVVMRTGFSTHTMNMGQRLVQLEHSYTVDVEGSATLHCSAVPPNPAIFPPGPAFLFVVVDGVPSVGIPIMVGSGEIGQQETQPPAPLPASFVSEGSILPAKGDDRTSFGRPMKAEISWPTMLAWTLGTIFWLGLF
ncbi:glyoxal oxidase [Multifurca ochricompacta]|uniref:Glyoxal oxidase n=1 Tax=Multifurca ochricompacta TaxID=376703 RepID=A0AAD4M8D5_9AGAM|nr:glyoxal oxidase [Multifurca ochricompacta]